ncbi:MAG: threonine ammonia-lyase [Actinomycetota bacterium]
MPVTFDDVRAAETRIADAIVRTPALVSERLDDAIGAHVVLKAETLQRGGAFKIRGATNAIRSLLGIGERPNGIAAYSSGNHAQAVALAAREAGLPAAILMPEDAPPEKRDATIAYGAEVVTFDRYTEDRDARSHALAEDRGFALVPPYDDVRVIAGQGTVALELFEDAGPLDALFVPVGGGGLIAGCAVVAEALVPSCRVIAVEPDASGDTARSLATGTLVREAAGPTIADGQQAPQGLITWDVLRGRVERGVTVSDEDLAHAMALLFTHAKLVAEPSGACGLAGLVRHLGELGLRAAHVGVVLSGANISPERFSSNVQHQ